MSALVVLLSASCTSSPTADLTSEASDIPPVQVEDSLSPVLGSTESPPPEREVSFVEILNWDGPGSQLEIGDNAIVIPFEITDSEGNDVRFLSTCFPAERCTSEQYVLEGECVALKYGGDDCLIRSESGVLHIIHVMQGPVTLAEALAAADIAERATT